MVDAVAGRTMVALMHSSRSSRSLTGRRVFCAMYAVTGSRMNSVLPPNEPPIGRLDHAHVVVLQAQQVGHHGADPVHALADAPDRQAPGAVRLHHADVRVESGVMDPRRRRRGGELDGVGRLDGATALFLVLVKDVAAGVDGEVVAALRLVGGEERRQLRVLDLDEGDGGLGDRLAGGHDRSDAVADEAHVLAEERLVGRTELLLRRETGAAVDLRRACSGARRP